MTSLAVGRIPEERRKQPWRAKAGARKTVGTKGEDLLRRSMDALYVCGHKAIPQSGCEMRWNIAHAIAV
jgi:hypothetical protein